MMTKIDELSKINIINNIKLEDTINKDNQEKSNFISK